MNQVSIFKAKIISFKFGTLGRLVLLIGLSASINIHAAIHYVRQGATGSASGNDWTNAYTSLPSTLIRGDTYFFADGSYSGRTFDTPVSGTLQIILKKATASDHGTDLGWSTTYGDEQAVFTSGFAFMTSYWVIDGQTGGGAGSWNSGFGFKIDERRDEIPLIKIGWFGVPANNITVRHVEMQGKGSVSNSGGSYSNDGVAIYDTSANTTISYAWMKGIGRCPVFMPGSLGAMFEHIYVESHYASDAVHSEVMSAGGDVTGDTTWRYSLIAHTAGTGGLMWDNHLVPTSHLYVYGNVFYQPAGDTWWASNGVIGGWTGANSEEFRNAIVYNNTFINLNVAPLSTLPRIYSGNVAYNNIFYNTPSPDFRLFESHDYNHFINSGGNHAEINGTSATSGDPFVNFLGFDFRLKAPTFAGLSFSSPFNRDPFNIIRGADGLWDRGAYEYGGGSGGSGGTNPSLTLLPPANLRVVQ